MPTAYLIGSLAGVVVLPYLGRLIDRFAPRRIMAAIAVCFGAILIAGSAAGEMTTVAVARQWLTRRPATSMEGKINRAIREAPQHVVTSGDGPVIGCVPPSTTWRTGLVNV